MDQRIDTEIIKQKIDLFNLIGSHVQLTRNAVKDFHGQCPKCGSAHGLHVYERDGKQLFRCYGCGVMGDVIAYVMWIDNLDFIEACKALGENLEAILELKPEKPIVHHSGSGDQVNKWNQEKSEKILGLAQSNLYGSDARGRNYLLSRGLNPETWATFGLGYKADVYLPGTWNSETKTASYPAQPAILIPWYRGGVLKAIRYRFIDKHTFVTLDGYESKEKVKVKSERGSSFRYLYGSQSLSGDDKSHRTLIVTEGEINAMSIWQVAHNTGIDVLSIGSETTEALTPSAIEAISTWGKVIGFVDKESTAVELADHLPSAIVISSEKGENGGKCDANDMLVAGELAGFIAAVRYNACKDDDDKRTLLSQLRYAGDYDALVAEIAQVIANDLGVNAPASATLDAQIGDDSTISEQLEHYDSFARDAIDQAEQVVESTEPTEPARPQPAVVQYQPLWQYVTDIDAMKAALRDAHNKGGDTKRYAAFLAQQLSGNDRFIPSNIKAAINNLSVSHLITDIFKVCLAISEVSGRGQYAMGIPLDRLTTNQPIQQ